MASVGHIAVGMAAARLDMRGRDSARPRLGSIVLWSLLSLLPDHDVVSFSLGVRYEDEWGHRGATHSLAFAAVAGAAIGIVVRLRGRPAARTGVTAALVLASHSLLDTLTDGGLGCALLWPFEQTRYFAPWNPIPVAPIGVAFLSPSGLMVSAVELVLFAPLLWFALRSRAGRPRASVRATAAGMWLIAAWFIASGDPVRQRIVGLLLSEDTEFVTGFSEAALRKTRLGESRSEVRARLGPPLNDVWFFRAVYPSGCYAVTLQGDEVVTTRDSERCRRLGVQPSSSRADAERCLGKAAEECWVYTRSRNGGYYRARKCASPAIASSTSSGSGTVTDVGIAPACECLDQARNRSA